MQNGLVELDSGEWNSTQSSSVSCGGLCVMAFIWCVLVNYTYPVKSLKNSCATSRMLFNRMAHFACSLYEGSFLLFWGCFQSLMLGCSSCMTMLCRSSTWLFVTETGCHKHPASQWHPQIGTWSYCAGRSACIGLSLIYIKAKSFFAWMESWRDAGFL